jgi:hypothetical protein
MDNFKCPYCDCEEHTSRIILEPDWRNPTTADFSVTDIFVCKGCGKEIEWPKDKKKE